MADNVDITAGTGTTVATDQVGSAHYQKIKLAIGVADDSTMIGHAEDAAHTSGDGGVLALAVRKDTAAQTAGTDGDYCALVCDSTGKLHVNVGNTVSVSNSGTFAVQAVCTNAGTFAVQAAQSGTWNITNVSGTISLPTGAATAAKQPALGTAGTASSDVITVQGITSMTPLLMSLSGSNTLTTVTTVGTVTTITNVVHVDDNSGSLTVDAPVGTPVFVRLSDGAAAITTLPVSLASVPSHAVTNAGTFAVQAAQSGTWTVVCGGDVAHDGVDSGNPVKVGAKAVSNLSGATLVSAGDRTNAVSDLDGGMVARPIPLGDLISESVSDTGGSSTAFTNFSAVASTKNYVTGISVFRTDAGTTMAYIDFRDGTGGSVLWRLPLPAGGGAVLPAGAVPYFRTSANTALAYDVSAALTTVYISVTGFQSKV